MSQGSRNTQRNAAGSAPDPRGRRTPSTLPPLRVKEEEVELSLHDLSDPSSSPDRSKRASISAILNPPQDRPPGAVSLSPSGRVIPPSATITHSTPIHRSPEYPSHATSQETSRYDNPYPELASSARSNSSRGGPSASRRRASDPTRDPTDPREENVTYTYSIRSQGSSPTASRRDEEPRPRTEDMSGPSYAAGPSTSSRPGTSPHVGRESRVTMWPEVHGDDPTEVSSSRQGQSAGEPQTWAEARIRAAQEAIQKQKGHEPTPPGGPGASPISPTRVKSVRFTGDTIQEDKDSASVLRERLRSISRRATHPQPDAPVPVGVYHSMQPMQRPASVPLQEDSSIPRRGRPPRKRRATGDGVTSAPYEQSFPSRSDDNTGLQSAQDSRDIQLGRFDAGEEAPALPRHLPPMPWFEIEYDEDVYNVFKKRWADLTRIYMNPNVPPPPSKTPENLSFQILDILRHLFFIYTTEGALIAQMASPAPHIPPMEPLRPPVPLLEDQENMAKWLKRVASISAPEIRHRGPRHERYADVLAPVPHISGILGEQYTYNPRLRARPPLLLSEAVLMWCMDILFRTKCSPSVMSVVIVYLVALEPAIRASMEQKYASYQAAMNGEMPFEVPRLSYLQVVFVACCILASKFESERVYSVEAWARITGLNAPDLVRAELEISEVLQWVFWVKPLLRQLCVPVVQDDRGPEDDIDMNYQRHPRTE